MACHVDLSGVGGQPRITLNKLINLLNGPGGYMMQLRFPLRILLVFLMFFDAFTRVAACQKKYYDFLRYNDADFSFLKSDTLDKDLFNPLKYIPLNHAGTSYLTLGGELRENYQWINNENWGDLPASWKDKNGFIWHRLMFHADLKLGKSLRLFGQLKNTAVISRAGGARPVTDRDDISLHQAFVDLNFGFPGNRFTVRAGRQEHNFGWGKLVSVREGPNNRQNFDGITLFHTGKFSNSRLFFANDISVETGAFDNKPVRNKYILGMYSTAIFPSIPGAEFEAYFIRSRTPQMIFAGDTGSDRRNTTGLRVARTKPGWIYEWETVYQWGKFSNRRVSAWSSVGMLGYRWEKIWWQPSFQLWGGISTGDKAGSASVNTYNPLYQRPPFTQAFAFGVSNINAAQWEFSLRPRKPIRLAIGSFLLERNTVDDGIYTPGVSPIRPLQWDSRIRFLSKRLAYYHYLEAEWFTGRHWQLNGQGAFVKPRQYIKQTGMGKTLLYVMLQATFRF